MTREEIAKEIKATEEKLASLRQQLEQRYEFVIVREDGSYPFVPLFEGDTLSFKLPDINGQARYGNGYIGGGWVLKIREKE